MSKRILVVDDNAAMRDLLMIWLRKCGYEPIIVHDGPAALQYLATHSVGLIITDYQMPTMSGLELLRRIRAQHGRLQVIVVSSNTEPALIREATLLGARAWLPKPVCLRTLRETVVSALQYADHAASEINTHG